MLSTPMKPTAPASNHPVPASTAPRDATRKDWPGPRWPFCVVQNSGGGVSIPLPLNEK